MPKKSKTNDLILDNLRRLRNTRDEILEASLGVLVSGGPDGTCRIHKNKRPRIKLRKYAYTSGEMVPHGIVQKLNASRDKDIAENIVENSNYVDKDYTISHIALARYKKLEFEALLDSFSNKKDRYVVCHSCHSPESACGNPEHIFVATNSVNQKQRVCSATGKKACTSCGFAMKQTALCECPTSYKDVLGKPVPECIHNPGNPGMIPELQLEIQQLKEKIQLLESELETLKHCK